MSVQVCERCDDVIVKTTEPIGHHSGAWRVVSAPTATNAGSLSGTCANCGKNVSKELPAFNSEAGKTFYTYIVTQEKKFCTDEGKAKYSFTIDEQSFEFEVVLIPQEHKLAGKALSEWENAEENAYDVKIEGIVEFADEHGRYNADTNGITEFADDRASCSGKHGKGYYTCEECGELVYVETYKEHTYKDYTVTKPATCTEDGEKTFTCEVCGAKATAKIEKLGHHYGVKITKFPTADAVGEAVITCDREGCNETHTVELPALNGEGAYKVTVIEKASCSKEGVNRYEFKDETTGETIAFETVTSMTAHTQGEHAKIYVWTADGVQYHGYVCEECGQMIVLESNPIEESAN